MIYDYSISALRYHRNKKAQLFRKIKDIAPEETITQIRDHNRAIMHLRRQQQVLQAIQDNGARRRAEKGMGCGI